MQGFYGPGWEVACMHAKSFQLCLTISEPMDCGPPGSSVQGILQARILEWVAISFSREVAYIRYSHNLLIRTHSHGQSWM